MQIRLYSLCKCVSPINVYNALDNEAKKKRHIFIGLRDSFFAEHSVKGHNNTIALRFFSFFSLSWSYIRKKIVVIIGKKKKKELFDLLSMMFFISRSTHTLTTLPIDTKGTTNLDTISLKACECISPFRYTSKMDTADETDLRSQSRFVLNSHCYWEKHWLDIRW